MAIKELADFDEDQGCEQVQQWLRRKTLLLNICEKVGLAAELTLRVSESVSLGRFESQRVR